MRRLVLPPFSRLRRDRRSGDSLRCRRPLCRRFGLFPSCGCRPPGRRIFRGYIDIPATGIYTFALASDDGAILRIGGRVVVNNDGEHPLLEKSGQVALSAGLHPLELRYFDYNGGEIRLVLLGDDGARHPLDTDLLRHDP